MDEPCKSCQGHCCKVGFVVQVFPQETEIYNDWNLVHQYDWPLGRKFKNMKSKGDGYTCIALGPDGECTIWPKRPLMCRDFEADGIRCRALRQHYGRP